MALLYHWILTAMTTYRNTLCHDMFMTLLYQPQPSFVKESITKNKPNTDGNKFVYFLTKLLISSLISCNLISRRLAISAGI